MRRCQIPKYPTSSLPNHSSLSPSVIDQMPFTSATWETAPYTTTSNTLNSQSYQPVLLAQWSRCSLSSLGCICKGIHFSGVRTWHILPPVLACPSCTIQQLLSVVPRMYLHIARSGRVQNVAKLLCGSLARSSISSPLFSECAHTHCMKLKCQTCGEAFMWYQLVLLAQVSKSPLSFLERNHSREYLKRVN